MKTEDDKLWHSLTNYTFWEKKKDRNFVTMFTNDISYIKAWNNYIAWLYIIWLEFGWNLQTWNTLRQPATEDWFFSDWQVLLATNMSSNVYSSVLWKRYTKEFCTYFCTLFEIFIFCPKIQLKFHKKNCQKNLGWKTRENVGVLSKLIFGQNLTFRIVCSM